MDKTREYAMWRMIDDRLCHMASKLSEAYRSGNIDEHMLMEAQGLRDKFNRYHALFTDKEIEAYASKYDRAEATWRD